MRGVWKCIEVVRATNESVYILECSNCGERAVVHEPPTLLREDIDRLWKSLDFCPNCNADMRSEEYIAEIERKKQEEDDFIERIADRVIQKLKDEKAEEERCKRELEFLNNIEHIRCDELPETGASGCIYYFDGREYMWFDGEWVRVG